VNDKHGRTPRSYGIRNAGFVWIVAIVMNAAVNVPPKSILLVDDDPAARESIKLLLSIDRHTVTEASSGRQALELFLASTYDLVITDYLMPGMLGDELADSIRNIVPGQPILMVTAYLEKLVSAGKPAEGMLGKPFSIDDLRLAMAKPTP
jgi:CheY-like chemotaxis protein